MEADIAPAERARAAFELDGRVAIVTGGGRGLGRAIAEGLVAHGARVVLAGRSEVTLQTVAAAIASGGGQAAIKVTDVTCEDDVVTLADFATERFGGIDVVVNNAGVNPYYSAPEDVTLSQWREIIDVNLTGVFLCCREIGRRMIETGGGSIINVSSVAGHVGLPKTTAYCAAKGGVEIMTKSLALDWAGKGVRVNCIAPGYFQTDLTAGLRDHEVLLQRLTSQTPLGRFGSPHEIVGAAVYLASPAADYVTGQSLIVDGGWTAS